MWYGVDPLAECYTSTSSYIYCRSNPINLVYPNGMYDKKTAQSVAQKYGAEYHQDKKSGCWYVSLNESGTGTYESDGTLTRDFGLVDTYKVKGYATGCWTPMIGQLSILNTVTQTLTYSDRNIIPFVNSSKLRLWQSPTDFRIRTNFNGRGPVTGKNMRAKAAARAAKLGYIGNVLTFANFAATQYQYEYDMPPPGIGPNMQQYLKSKYRWNQTINTSGFVPNLGVQLFNVGYSLGGIIDAGIRKATDNRKCLQINPYTTNLNCNPFDGFGLDFTPTEQTIQYFDDHNINMY